MPEADDTKVITAADSYSFLSVDETRAIMGGLVASLDDGQLQTWIDAASDTIATLCNRVFAFEEVVDTFDVGDQRLWLMRWPVLAANVASIQVNGSDIVANGDQWRVSEGEPGFGKLSIFASIGNPIKVSYKGGYELPDDAPPALKQACELLVRNAHLQMTSLAQTGVRQLSHKGSRVTYFDPATLIKAQQGAGGTQQALENLLYRYRRIEC